MKIDISTLSVGQEFKNLQELSLLVLGEKLPKGKGRTNRINQMKQYFSWSNLPHSQKVCITEIYSSKHKPLDPRCKYAPLIYNILSTYPNELSFTKTELLHILGIVNDNFDPKNFIPTANKLKVKYKVLKIITTDIYTILNNIIMKGLQQLESHGYISIEETKQIFYDSSSANEISPEVIDKLYKDNQHVLSCNNYFEVIKNNLLSEYKSLCKESLQQLGVRKVVNLYKITILRPLESSSEETTLNTLCKNYLFNHYSNNPIAKKIINHYTSLSTEGF